MRASARADAWPFAAGVSAPRQARELVVVGSIRLGGLLIALALTESGSFSISAKTFGSPGVGGAAEIVSATRASSDASKPITLRLQAVQRFRRGSRRRGSCR